MQAMFSQTVWHPLLVSSSTKRKSTRELHQILSSLVYTCRSTRRFLTNLAAVTVDFSDKWPRICKRSNEIWSASNSGWDSSMFGFHQANSFHIGTSTTRSTRIMSYQLNWQTLKSSSHGSHFLLWFSLSKTKPIFRDWSMWRKTWKSPSAPVSKSAVASAVMTLFLDALTKLGTSWWTHSMASIS